MSEERKNAFQILNDVKNKVFGIKEGKTTQDGFVISFLPIGQPVNPDDYSNPWTPDLNLNGASLNGNSESTMTPQIAEAITKRQRNLMNICQLVDKKIQLNQNGEAITIGSKISDTWKIIVDGASALPIEPLNDPVLKQQLEDAYKLLWKEDPEDPESVLPTNTYIRYRDNQKKYSKAIQTFNAQYVVAMLNPITAQTWPIISKTYQADVDAALDDWNSLGKKEKVEGAIALLSSQGCDAATKLIASIKKDWEKYNVGGGMLPVSVPYIQLFPRNWCEKESEGWSKYEFKNTEVNNTRNSENTNWGAGGSFWGISGGVSNSEKKETINLSTEGLHIAFEYALIDIERPWLNTLLFNLNNWHLYNQKQGSISKGSLDQQTPSENETCWLPAIPTKIFVIRNLFINTTQLKKEWNKESSSFKSGGSIGIESLRLGGRYENEEISSEYKSGDLGEGLYVEGIQILGWLSQVVPLSPRIDYPKNTNTNVSATTTIENHN